jgi:diacylglycerol kinase
MLMKWEFGIVAATFAFYIALEQGQYQASWRVHLFAILVPILILKFVKDLDLKARIFIMTILAWHVIDVLNNAIGERKKSSDLVHRHAHPESDASGVDAGVGPAPPEVPQEREETSQTQSGLGAPDMG